jgi:tetratricopeptide (TPR) repeat protein
MPDSKMEGCQYYDKYTFKAIREAQNQARESGQLFTGPEFLLLGLLRTHSESHSYILNLLSLSFDSVYPEVVSIVGIGFRSPRTTCKPALTPKAKTIISKAISKADSNMQAHVSCIYLLWALIEDETNLAAKILSDLLSNLDVLKQLVHEEIAKPTVFSENQKQLDLHSAQNDLLLENTRQRSNLLQAKHNQRQFDYCGDKSSEENIYIQNVLNCLGINPDNLKLMKKNKRRRYRIILQFLTDSLPASESNTSDKHSLLASANTDEEASLKGADLSNVQKYLQTFAHFWLDLEEFDKAILFLQIPLNHINNLKLCKQLHEWGYYEQERYIYKLLLSMKSGLLSNSDQHPVFSLLLSRNYDRTGQFNKAYKEFKNCFLFQLLQAPHLVLDEEIGRHRILDIFDNTHGIASYYHYYFMARILEAKIHSSQGFLGQAAEEYEKCCHKALWLEQDGLLRRYKYTVAANLELKLTALLGCGNCYFKLKDYGNALQRFEYAEAAFIDFMADSNNDEFILSPEHRRNLALISLSFQISLGIAQAYHAMKLYSEAHRIYSGVIVGLNTYFCQESLKSFALRIEYLTAVGKTYCAQKKYKDALGVFVEALKISKRIKDSQSEAIVCSNLANIYFFLRDYETANEYYVLFEHAICNPQLLGYEAVVIYMNWTKVLRKLRKYTKAISAVQKSRYHQILLNRSLDQMKIMQRNRFEKRKLDFELNITNPILKSTYSCWNRIENSAYRFYYFNRDYIYGIVSLAATLALLPVMVLVLPIIVVVTIFESATEDKS